MSSMSWQRIPCLRAELKLEVVLMCGQSFRWREVESGIFRSVLRGHVISLKQDDDNILYCLHGKTHGISKPKKDPEASSQPPEVDVESLLRDYFQLHISTEKLHEQWSKNDRNFQGLYKNYSGIRVLRQDATENLFSFICSSNNNISRISSMVENLAIHFGEKVMSMDSVGYHSFPSVSSLAQTGVEEKLRKLGFGYRAKFVVKSAEYIVEKGGESWLEGLREKSYEEAKEELLKLCGVGDKVADCVLLMSLDKPGAIPIDTHIAAVARQNYLPNLPNNKTITAPVYRQIGEHLRALWGDYAGWAQAVVFSADLPKFKVTYPASGKKPQKRKRPST